MQQLLHRMVTRAFTRRASEAGYVAVLVAIIVPLVGIGCAATAVDTGRWYVEVQRVQRTADAAALAGVPYLPQDLPSAVALAKTVAKRNGYDDASANVTVTAALGEKATQLQVTISSTIDNVFGAVIGVPRVAISRTGVADYQGPAPMGSPCNTFGNEPPAGTAGSSATPSGTAHGTSPLANCAQTPQFWATIEGPETGKVQGDRYQTRKCEQSGVDGCSGTTNDEYDDFGYTFLVKVNPAAVNTPVELQLYDPMFVNTGQKCELLPYASSFNAWGDANPYVTNSDAQSRYSRNGAGTASYCPGDSYAGNGSGANPNHPLWTSFALRQQTDTQNPKNTPIQTDTSGHACIKQYGSYNTSGSGIPASLFQSGAYSGYNDEISSEFHNWVEFCTFTPTRAGDYYLQVRTNVSPGGSGSGYIKSGNSAVADVAGNSPSGEGTNSFAMRAVTQTGKEKEVAVSGYNHMPIFVNTDAAQPVFNLIRILPGAAGQKISFSYFDAGDAASNGSVQVQVPGDATGTITSNPFPGGCKAVGGSAGSSSVPLTNCNAPFQQYNGVSKNNGKTETITIPIPADYTCNYTSFGGCWYKVKIAFGSGGVHDVTTWDATVIGDPVRLVR